METYTNNFLQNNGFAFVLDRLPQTVFRITAVDVPSITVPPAPAGFPGVSQYFPGTFNEFDELSVTFLVDENLENYGEMFHWITQQRFAIGDAYVAKNDFERLLVSDGVLTTMTNASNPNRVFKFKGLFPISLGNLHFDTTVTEPTPVTCTAVFKYTEFVLE